MLAGSGVLPVVLVEVVEPGVPRRVNDSEGMVPTVLSCASDGQPGEVQPFPEFSFQYTGSPLGVEAFSRVSQ